eukprot:COSAG02_NODE_1185_length_14007_cov_52.908398_7_plen_982_part_00
MHSHTTSTWKSNQAVTVTVYLMSLLYPTSSSLVGWWAFDGPSTRPGSVPDRAGGPPATVDSGGVVVKLGDSNDTHALRLWGNTSATFTVAHHRKIDQMDEFTVTMWLNWWYGGGKADGGKDTLLSKDSGFLLEIYRGFLKTNVVNTNGTIEWTPYPLGCGYIQPAKWIHLALSYSKNGRLHLTVQGKACFSENLFWMGMAELSGKNGPDYSTPRGPFTNTSKDLSIGGWSGLVSDVRLYDCVLKPAEVAAIHKSSHQVYNQTPFQQPGEAEIQQLNRTWRAPVIGPAEHTMYNAWLNHNALGAEAPIPSWLDRVLMIEGSGYDRSHPVWRTAKDELHAAFPIIEVHGAPTPADVDSFASLVSGSIVIGTCKQLYPAVEVLSLGAVRQLCQPASLSEDSYVLELFDPQEKGIDSPSKRPVVVAVGAGMPGVLYAAFALVEHLQLRRPWTATALERKEVPSTSIRCLNHWSQWRGLPWGRWLGESGRGDSIFSWADLRAADGKHTAPSMKRIRDWARLLAAVGINAIAPQDVNWAEDNNYLRHLDVLPVLGDAFRAYAIRLYFTPNYLLAAEQTTADALYRAVPDFGGYLLKIGSEKQGGHPDVATINPIAKTLLRSPGSGERNGSVLLRGFIYGSMGCISSGFNYSKQSRFAIPPSVFGPGDGKYEANVHIIGKYSPLDFETQEPANPMDGLLKHTKYGPEYVVGKDGFMMSWVSRWADWLIWDNYRGVNGGSLLNRDCIDAVLGVAMMGTPASWTTNPLGMVNYYGFGRLAWDATLSPDQIYAEFIERTFGTQMPPHATSALQHLLTVSEEPATQLGIYHGYRGVWYENGKASAGQEGTFESPTSVKQIINRRYVGTTKELARQAFDAYSPGVQEIYSNYTDSRTEAVLLEWGLFEYNYTLTNGRTILEDMMQRPVEGATGAQRLLSDWTAPNTAAAVKQAVGKEFYDTVTTELEGFVQLAQTQVHSVHSKLAKLHPTVMH